jgi:hypothetical protein
MGVQWERARTGCKGRIINRNEESGSGREHRTEGVCRSEERTMTVRRRSNTCSKYMYEGAGPNEGTRQEEAIEDEGAEN